MPARRPSNVDLPLPDCPTIAANSPRSIVMSMWSSAVNAPAATGYALLTSRIRMSGLDMCRQLRSATIRNRRGEMAPFAGAVAPFSEAHLHAAQTRSYSAFINFSGSRMKNIVAAALAVALVAAPVAAQHSTGAARPALAPAAEAKQFDFLIGQWELVVLPEASTLAAK